MSDWSDDEHSSAYYNRRPLTEAEEAEHFAKCSAMRDAAQSEILALNAAKGVGQVLWYAGFVFPFQLREKDMKCHPSCSCDRAISEEDGVLETAFRGYQMPDFQVLLEDMGNRLSNREFDGGVYRFADDPVDEPWRWPRDFAKRWRARYGTEWNLK